MASSGITSAPADAAPGCYASGTPILTDRGEVPIEALAVGDLVVTSTGERRPIRRVGRRLIDCLSHPSRDAVLPVRIAAHAFAPGRPSRDVLIAPAHAICVDVLGEVLIPATALINGATVATVSVEAIDYRHVELDGHDTLVAAGLPAESCRETGISDLLADRPEANPSVREHGAPDRAPARRDGAYRPFHRDGLVVAGVRAQLAARAAALGWVLESGDPLADLHLLAAGRRIDPVRRGLVARFTLPPDVGGVQLVSGAARPLDLGISADPRLLGVDVEAFAVIDGFGAPRMIAIDDTRLARGFHEMEAPEGSNPPHRWTDGQAEVPAELLGDRPDGAYLAVTLAQRALPRWVARPAPRAEPTAER